MFTLFLAVALAVFTDRPWFLRLARFAVRTWTLRVNGDPADWLPEWAQIEGEAR